MKSNQVDDEGRLTPHLISQRENDKSDSKTKEDQTSESLSEDKTIDGEDEKKETKKDKKQLLI